MSSRPTDTYLQGSTYRNGGSCVHSHIVRVSSAYLVLMVVGGFGIMVVLSVTSVLSLWSSLCAWSSLAFLFNTLLASFCTFLWSSFMQLFYILSHSSLKFYCNILQSFLALFSNKSFSTTIFYIFVCLQLLHPHSFLQDCCMCSPFYKVSFFSKAYFKFCWFEVFCLVNLVSLVFFCCQTSLYEVVSSFNFMFSLVPFCSLTIWLVYYV